MAIITTNEFDGLQPVPAPCSSGEVHEVRFTIDTSATNLAAGDFIQLMYVPDDAVLSDIRVGVSATTGTATIAAGIADALVTTALSTTFIAAAAITTTAVVSATSAIMADAPVATHTSGQRIVALAIGTAAMTTQTIYVSVQYRSGRYGG